MPLISVIEGKNEKQILKKLIRLWKRLEEEAGVNLSVVPGNEKDVFDKYLVRVTEMLSITRLCS